ncbi:MAG TPA: RNA-binding cell elongation regulator Jag/EloR [Dehalococcoidia bacterium]|nr:RNA-binding cell elongation regulator Jag/EloR [Dehalococcoidia bacterium]
MGLKREEVEVTVLSRGRPGLLGIGTQEARVLVSPRPGPDPASYGKEVLEELLDIMKIPASIRISQPPPGLGPPPPIALDIKGQDLGILIGRQGQTLASLQYLVNVIVALKLKAQAPIWVDVEGYKKRRYENLRTLANRIAEQVEKTGQPVTLEPMPAHERRIVHLALADHPDITTQSTGEEPARKVVIAKRPVREGKEE